MTEGYAAYRKRIASEASQASRVCKVQSVKAGGCPECYERDAAWKRGCGAGEVTEDTAGFGCW